ncbi:hypothetical protein BC828DRAFT_391162 [Blastocladiella britannica]|nr:hypothetical protein BC828DRAFT_391162 [Blastocladiella britannica]
MSKKSLIADRSFLGKPLPRSAKYANTVPTVDSGSSLSSQLRSVADSFVHHKFLPNELFVRLKPALLAQIIYETQRELDVVAIEDAVSAVFAAPDMTDRLSASAAAAIAAQAAANAPHFIHSRHRPLATRETDSVGPLMATPTDERDMLRAPADPLMAASPAFGRSMAGTPASFSGTPGGFSGQATRRRGGAGGASVSSEVNYDMRMPYLLLDIRGVDPWRECHIVGALPYPHQYIKRDQISRDLYMFRNKADKIIILYDDDEGLAVPAAQALGERGFENVFVLSGGITHLAQRITGLFVGVPPHAPGRTPASLPQLASRPTSVASRTSTTTASSKSQLARKQASTPAPRPRVDHAGVFNMHDLERSLLDLVATPFAQSAAGSRASSRMSARDSPAPNGRRQSTPAMSTTTTTRGGGGGGGPRTVVPTPVGDPPARKYGGMASAGSASDGNGSAPGRSRLGRSKLSQQSSNW